MPKINILFCIEYLYHGGTEKQLLSLINGLDKNKFCPHLCCLRKSIISKHRKKIALDLFENIDIPKIQLDYISLRDIKSWMYLFQLRSFMKKNKIDIVQNYFQDPAILGLIAGKLAAVPYEIACFRDMGFWRYHEFNLKMKIVYRLYSFYIANSNAVRNSFLKQYNLQNDKFHVIYNGIDLRPFESLKRKEKADLFVSSIGIVSNLNRDVKRVDVFLKAAAYVLKRIPKMEFFIAGDGELKQNLVFQAKKLGIFEHVKFLGEVENIPKFLSRIDIGIICSDSEGFSNAILEYMASGIPVIATDVGGNREIIEHNVNGILVSAGDFTAIGEASIRLATEKDLYLKFRENCIQAVSQKYSLNKYIKNYEIYYEELLLN